MDEHQIKMRAVLKALAVAISHANPHLQETNCEWWDSRSASERQAIQDALVAVSDEYDEMPPLSGAVDPVCRGKIEWMPFS